MKKRQIPLKINENSDEDDSYDSEEIIKTKNEETKKSDRFIEILNNLIIKNV